MQAGYKAQTLSDYLGKRPPSAAPEINWPTIDPALLKARFFEFLDLVMDFAPPGPEEAAIRAKLARLGVGTSGRFELGALPPELQAAVARGMKAGSGRIDQRIANLGSNINGWQVAAAFGNRDFFNGDWQLRAAAAWVGIYGLDAEEAMYPMTRAAVDGGELDASKHKFTMTFPKG